MPGTAIGFPSGKAGRAGKRSGGMRMMVDQVTRFEPRARINEVTNHGALFYTRPTRQRWLITGQTKSGTGVAIPGCQVTLFKTVDNMPVATTVSDYSGNYEFSVDGNSQARFAVSYKTGSPDITGATVNTLIPVLT